MRELGVDEGDVAVEGEALLGGVPEVDLLQEGEFIEAERLLDLILRNLLSRLCCKKRVKER